MENGHKNTNVEEMRRTEACGEGRSEREMWRRGGAQRNVKRGGERRGRREGMNG